MTCLARAFRMSGAVPVGFFVLLLCAALAGCGGPASKGVKFSGKVMYKGEPLPAGTIQLHGANQQGPPTMIQIEPDGTFLDAQAPEGEWKVTIETETVKKRNDSFKLPGTPPPGADTKLMKRDKGMPADAKQQMQTYVPIPLKYSDPAKSGFTVTLKKGEPVEKEFVLTAD